MRAGQVDIEIAENVVDTDLPTSKNKIKVPGIDAEKAERTTTMEQTTLLEWKSHLGSKIEAHGVETPCHKMMTREQKKWTPDQ